MEVKKAERFLLWCTILNLAILCFWFAMVVWNRDLIHQLHGRWFSITPERFDAIHYAGMAFYKILILVFNLTPWLAIRIIKP
ncbi:MAG: DUF6868 family protein [Elusimicrobiota bacterium]